MKKVFFTAIAILVMGTMLQGCGTKNEIVNDSQPSGEVETNIQENKLSSEMAYEGVNTYCHNEYDWSVAEDNPSIMYVEMGDEPESEYHVIFRSYTGALVHFYVDKSTGKTRIIEAVPNLNVENEVGTINIYDYLN